MPSYKGASTHILAFCRALAQEHRVTLLTLGDRPLPPWHGFTHGVFPLDEPNPLRRGLAFRERVSAWLTRHPVDVVHFRSPWEGVAAADLGVPCVYEVNGLPSMELSYHYPKVTGHTLEVLSRWEARCLAVASAVVCPAEQIRTNLLVRHPEVEPGRITVIPNGYFEVTLSRRRPRRPPDQPVPLVYLGTLSPWQGVFWALRALRGLGERFSLDIYAPYHRVLSPLAEKCIRTFSLAGTVRLCGPVDRVRFSEVLPRYAVGLCPLTPTSRNLEQGCCPVKLLDYASFGLWAVAPDLPAVREVVTQGKSGFLYRAGDPDSFRQALMDAASAPAAPHPRDGGLVTWEEAGRRLRRVYSALVT